METLFWAAWAAATAGCLLTAAGLFTRKNAFYIASQTAWLLAMLAFIAVDVHRHRTDAVVLDSALALFWAVLLTLTALRLRKAAQQ